MSFDPAADPERRKAKDRAKQRAEAAGTQVPDVSAEEKDFADWLKKRSWKD